MTQQASDSADEIRSNEDNGSDSNENAGDGSSANGNRTADDPFDRKRLERLRAIADPAHPEADPLADVDTTVVSPGDGGTTGPDEVIDLDWEVDLTAEGILEEPATTREQASPPVPPEPPALANDPRSEQEIDTEVG